jgi:hypothetical protein
MEFTLATLFEEPPPTHGTILNINCNSNHYSHLKCFFMHKLSFCHYFLKVTDIVEFLVLNGADFLQLYFSTISSFFLFYFPRSEWYLKYAYPSWFSIKMWWSKVTLPNGTFCDNRNVLQMQHQNNSQWLLSTWKISTSQRIEL